jgi:hypothetical protein
MNVYQTNIRDEVRFKMRQGKGVSGLSSGDLIF